MCGFCGIISKNELPAFHVEKGLFSIKHRGPDDSLICDGENVYSIPFSSNKSKANFPKLNNETSPYWLGFNRLSIVDQSSKGMQPFINDDKTCVFMMNGEVYNFEALKRQELADVQLHSKSDSEVAFHLYLKYGDDFVHLLKGMFAILILDKKANSLKAWRDRFGIKPFYYSMVNRQFIFASEIKAIHQTECLSKDIDYQGLAYSMYFNTCPAPLTIYKHVKSLPAGYQLIYKLDTEECTTQSYWHLDYSPENRKIQNDEFLNDLTDLAELYSTGDVKKAIMLSGGLDSGMLAYAFGKSDNNYQCLSIYKANHPDNEIKFAKANAANAGLNIEPIEIPEFDNQYLRRFFMHAEEEPNSGPEPAKLLSEYAANENYKVLYSALGPDEIFGGYPYFQFVRKYAKVSSIFSLIPAFVFPSKYRSKVRDIKRYGIAYYPFLSRSLFSWESIVKIIHNHNKKIPEHPLEYIRKQVNEINPQFKHLPILKQVSYLEMHYYIGSHHSVRSDIPSMQHSIEMRFPFLDHEFVQKYFNQTNTFNELKNKPKPEMYRFSAPFLPNEVMQMPKRGFTIPLAKNNSTKKPRQIWYLEALVNTFPQLKKDFLEKS